MSAVHTWHRGYVSIWFKIIFFKPQNVEQGISNVEVNPSSFCHACGVIRYSIFNVFNQLKSFPINPTVSSMYKNQPLRKAGLNL